MNDERTMRQGQLAQAEEEYDLLDLKSKGLIHQLRSALDPFEPDLTRLKTGQIKSAAKDLADNIAKMKGLKERINQLQEALGIG